MCGIFGTINANKPKRFRYTAFAGLGIINDSRGGDSCGIFIDGKYEYGVYTKKFFKDFMLESKLLEEFRGQEVSVAIGHCRKASVGATTEANAQPVILKDENGNPEFVLIHNGTIKNYEELAKKYIPNIETKDMTDSQIMARIFYHKGYQVLSEYYGGSVFFIVDYRKGTPECRFFQGYSKNTEYTKDQTQERPFYFAYRDGTFIFSSIYEMLAAACPGADIWEPAANTLYCYTSKGLVSEKEYPRDNVAQTLPYSKTTTTYGKSTTSYAAANNKSIAEKIEDRKQASSSSVVTTPSTSTSTNTVSSISKNNDEKLPKDVKDQVRSNSDLIGKRLVYDYQTSRYLVEGKPLHGVYCLSSYGTIVDEDSYQSKNTVWFFSGIPFLNKGQYFYDRFRAICLDFKISPSEFVEKYPTVIRWYSSDRIFRDPLTNILVVATSPKERTPYTGMFMRLCEVYGSKFEKGLEMDHCVIDANSSKVTFLNNENQGGSKINTEISIAKQIKKVCLELKKG